MATVLDMMKQYGYFTEDSYQPKMAAMCLSAAKEYLKNADVVEPEGGSYLYDLACYMLAMHWYDNRGVVVVGTVQDKSIAMGVQSIIHQIKSY